MQVAENGADAMRRVYDDEDAHMYASPTDSKSVNAMLSDEEDEEEAECRVCRGEAEPDRRLYAPCKCSGSIRFIHSECLEQWLEHSGKDYCELCSHKFEFKPLYDQNAPDVLPTQELVATVLSMVFYKWLPFVVRACMVAALWLGVAPWCTSWLYRMWLLRASAMVNVNFSERFDVTHVVADVYSGIVLIVIIIFSFLALMSFADFLRFHLDHIEAEAADLRLNEIIHIPVEPVAPAVAAPPPAPIVDEVEEGEQHMPFPGVIAQHPREELGLPAIRPAEEDVLMEDHRPEQELRQRRPLGDAVEGPRAPVVVDQAQPVRNMPAPAAPPRRPPPRNNNRDAWDDDFEHMEINIAMDELLGLRGDIVVLFRNVSWLLAFNGAYLGLFAFIPYTLGSTISTAATKIFSSLPIASTLSAFIADDPNVPVDDLSIGGFFVRMLISAMEVAKKNGDCLQLVDLCTCVVGYVSICFTIVLWRWMVTTASPFMNRPLMGGVQWALRCLTAIVKVSTLLLLKMVALPIILGYGIDVATLRLFSATMQERIVFSTQHMVGSLLIHWVVGISFMLFITVSVLQLREVMHPDILAKVIRPQEAHPDLLRSILGETCMKHAKRMILSLIIYAGLLTMLIHIPIRLLHSSAPSLFPVVLRFQYYSPEIQVPLELLVVHLIVLAILEHAKNEIGRLQHLGINFFCSQFGLTEHILPRVKVSWTSHTAQVGEEWVLGPPPLHFHPLAELPPDELRILGRRYLPWPEEGLEDSQPVEYELLPRRTPTKWLHARIATLLVVCWFVLVTSVGALMAGTFFLGRVSLAPLERLTGIQHDPLALAAGVQIVWYLANGLNALNVLTMPEVEVESALVRRGYCVKNMNAGNAIVSVFGWAFFGPLFLGYIMSMCIPSAQATGFESFWMGYLFFNLSAWFVCCFHLKRRRRQRRGQDILPEEDFNDNFDDFVEPEDFVDEVEEDMDEQVALANAVEGGGEAQERLAAENVLLSLRLCYTKLMFNLEVHDSDAIRLRRDNIRERCFDVQMFITEVMTPILGALLAVIVLCKIQSAIVMYAWSAVSSGHPETAHTVATIGAFLTVVLGSSHGLVKKWTNNLAESIRNERYLIGRQLQDMVR